MNSTQYKMAVSNIQLAGYTPSPSQISAPVLLTLLEKPRFFSGYLHGYRQPVGSAKLSVASFNQGQVKGLEAALAYYFAEYAVEFTPIQSEQGLIACLGEGVTAIQKAAGLPIFESIQLECLSEAKHACQLWMPALHEACFHQAMAFMLQFFYQHLPLTDFVPSPAILKELADIIARMKMDAPQGSNSLRLLEAAHHAGIPWMHLSQNVFQYGYGSHSRWLDSTFTDKTPHLAAGLAKSKRHTNLLMQRAGLPVTEQLEVYSEQEAVEKANQLGYPVVIKPNNQDTGVGVAASLLSDTQVRRAYQHAKQYSSVVLLEKQVVGKDYRLLVINGELIWAIERIPAGVRGDGVSTIQALIETVNQQRGQGTGLSSRLKKIALTDELTDYLADQQLDLHAVPAADQFVPLSRIANISSGGTPVAVFDKVHPDNKRLAETAATLMRLDIAGIDFITPTIEESYLVTGGALIEINAQPQLGTITSAHLYRYILARLLPHQGRIPIMVLCGVSASEALTHDLMALLSKDYKNVAIVNGDDVTAGGILCNPKIEALIYCINSWSQLAENGLPFDQYDDLFFLEMPNNRLTNADVYLIEGLFNACRGYQFTSEQALHEISQCNLRLKSNMILVKNNKTPNENYPAYIEAIAYLDEQSQLLIESTADRNCTQSTLIMKQICVDEIHDRGNLMLSLWNLLRNLDKSSLVAEK